MLYAVAEGRTLVCMVKVGTGRLFVRVTALVVLSNSFGRD